jgi:PAS domain S-box-containing protein
MNSHPTPGAACAWAVPWLRPSRRVACAVAVVALVFSTGFAAEAPRQPRVGVLTDNYPFSFRDADGQLRGFAYELVVEIERVMGLRFERVVGTTQEINGAFPNGNVDVLQSFARTPEREGFAEFSVPYLEMAGQIFVREGSPPVRALADLKGRKVLVHRGSLGEQVLRRAGLEDSVVIVDSVEQALVRLDRGEGDATLATRLTGLAIAHKFGLRRLRVLDVTVEGYEVGYCIAVRKGDYALLARINEGMALLVRTGKFDDYYQKWFGFVAPAGFTSVQILLAVAGGLAVALLVAIWAVARQRVLSQQLARQAEIAHDSEERYRQLVALAPIGIAVHGEGKLVFANLAAARILGAESPEGVIGREAIGFVHPDERARTMERIRGLLTGATGFYAAENTYVKLDGSPTHVEVMSTPLVYGGRPAVQVIVADITARKRAEEQARAASEQLRALAARLHSVREEERTAIAREIHDVLAQELTRLKIDLIWLAKRVAQPVEEPLRAAVAARVADAIAQTDTAISTVQRIATELRPVILDSLGLPAAIEWQTEDFGRRTGLVCRARVPRGGTALPRDGATAVFRILQESLTNVARYARATEVEVAFTETAGAAVLTVRDNGVGITPAQIDNPRAIGLLGMRERALALGGVVEISGSPGQGTTVTVRLPLAVPSSLP